MSGKGSETSPRKRGKKDKDQDESNDYDKGVESAVPTSPSGGGGSRLLHVFTIIVAVGLAVGIGQFMQPQMTSESVERQIRQLKTQLSNLEKLSKADQDKKADKKMVQNIRDDVSKFESRYASKDDMVKEIDSRTDVSGKKVEERVDSKLELLRKKFMQDSEKELSRRVSEVKDEVAEEFFRIKKEVDAQFAKVNTEMLNQFKTDMAGIVEGPGMEIGEVKTKMKATEEKVDEVVSKLEQIEKTIDEKIEAGKKKMKERMDKDMDEIRSTVTNWFNELQQKQQTTDKKGKP